VLQLHQRQGQLCSRQRGLSAAGGRAGQAVERAAAGGQQLCGWATFHLHLRLHMVHCRYWSGRCPEQHAHHAANPWHPVHHRGKLCTVSLCLYKRDQL
jgi:hypothetical protein